MKLVPLSRFSFLLFALVLLLLLPATVTSSPSQTDPRVEARIITEGTGQRFAFHGTTDPGPESKKFQNASECMGEPFTPRSRGFSFRSDQTQGACGASVWTVTVPQGAKEARLSFEAQRNVEPSVPGGSMEALQEIGVYTEDWLPLEEQTLFPVHQTGQDGRSFDIVVRLPDEAGQIHLVWVFEDRGTPVTPELTASPAGGSFHAHVSQVDLTFAEVPVPLVSSASSATEGNGAATVSFQVPSRWYDPDMASSIEILLLSTQSYAGHRITLPSGEELAADQLRIEPHEGETENESFYGLRFPPTFINAAGPGVYTVHFEPIAPMVSAGMGGFTAAALTSVPVVVAFFAAAALYLRPFGDSKKGALEVLLPFTGFFVVAAAFAWLALLVGPAGLFSWSLEPRLWGPAILFALWTVIGTAIVLHRLWQGFKVKQAAQTAIAKELDDEKTAHLDAQEALYTLAHDLKTPIITLDYLVDELADTEHQAKSERDRQVSFDRTHGVISEMDKKITAMMDFAKGTDMSQDPGEVHVRQAVEQAAQMLSPNSERKGTRVEIDADGETRLSVSPESFNHVIVNLIDNAIKYGPDQGGLVRIRLRDRGRSKRTGGFVLEVADNGTGIARQDRQRIFKLLTRVPDPGGRDLPGTGVGLAVVRRVVAAQNGRIEVAHAPEGGALMRVIWPPSRVRSHVRRRQAALSPAATTDPLAPTDRSAAPTFQGKNRHPGKNPRSPPSSPV